jgi:hypothetical protein
VSKARINFFIKALIFLFIVVVTFPEMGAFIFKAKYKVND